MITLINILLSRSFGNLRALKIISDWWIIFAKLHYVVFVNQGNSVTVGGLQGAKGIDNPNKGTRDYVAAVGYDPENRSYSTVICRSIDEDNNYTILGLRATGTTTGTGSVAAVTGGTQAQCDGSAGVQRLE
ncbi:hypothetical protein CwatDRAFT_3181 [Crocosphaera watsonii WH 8501]|uniref:Uncharacterized protein n=1 Tax=Crocosphaera watsonii WH 8501 TaxID=165597 RepID=Q4C0F0_CROWT|nr:hypothetical protein CwatDRAFT_3181 [Crocosphaera watsonii WH 8501]